MKENINGSVLHFWLNAVQHIQIKYKLSIKNENKWNYSHIKIDENTLILVMCWTALHLVGTYLNNCSTVGSTK